MKKIKRKIKKHVKERTYFAVYKAIYITGLAILIPMIFAFAFGGEGPWYSKPITYIFSSLFLIFFAFFGMLKRKRTLSETLKSLGKMSLVPGFIALVFYAFGGTIVYSFMRVFVPGFDAVEPFVRVFIESSVPRMGILVLGYIVVGAVLYYLGESIKK
ncbi:hypothetical protein JW707_01985 [Candidatus Woesearchaeota archaeon]|nr:hypothetical protein [Candidatus Woesearchaeota archaeon]